MAEFQFGKPGPDMPASISLGGRRSHGIAVDGEAGLGTLDERDPEGIGRIGVTLGMMVEVMEEVDGDGSAEEAEIERHLLL